MSPFQVTVCLTKNRGLLILSKRVEQALGDNLCYKPERGHIADGRIVSMRCTGSYRRVLEEARCRAGASWASCQVQEVRGFRKKSELVPEARERPGEDLKERRDVVRPPN